MLSVAVDCGNSGSNAIIAAPGIGRRIKVHGYLLMAVADVSATWLAGATALSGPLPCAANGGACAPPGGTWFHLPDNTALNLSLSGAEDVAGHVAYTIDGGG